MTTFSRFLPAFLFIFVASLLQGQTDPHITSWVTARSYARVYETASDKTNGNAVSTWPRSGLTNGGGGQATVVYSDVQRVVYSTNYVYVYVTGLPSYTAGNWVTPNNMVYTSWPTNRGTIQKIPRNVTIPTTKQKNNGSGGVLVNGVFVWQNGDAQSYANASSTASVASISMNGDGIWNRLAGVAETFNFDPAYGHQPSSGAYHNHINPIALRYQLGDNVTYNAATKTYAESSSITKHSPLIGWANDGLPIYGPYGYSSALDSTSGIRRMTSGFVKRDSTNAALYGVDDLAVTGRVKLPVWAASVQGRSQTLTTSQQGPKTTDTYALGPVNKTCVVGTFAEDYEYLGDFGKTQGVDFDLNRQNVRFCKTPEYPDGTYAYFVCIDSSGNTVFPDIINQEYFGTAAMGPGTVSSITESVTEYVTKRGGQASAIDLSVAASTLGAKLTWTSIEGGTYTVASSPDGTTYTTLSASVASAGTTTTYDTATLAPYYKVTLTAVATYDTNGNGGISGVGNSASVYYAAGGAAPSITSQPSGQTVAAGTKITFTVAATGTATLTYQWNKDGSPISGATSASYVITTSKAADSGTYTVVVTNGSGTATSDDAVLVVNNPPVITTQPATQAVAYGASLTFSVAATSAEAVTYQWKKAGVAISGQTGDTYTIPAAAFADAGSYTVVVTNAVTGGATTSSAATLTVVVPTPTFSLASSIPIRGSVSVDLTGGNAVSDVTYFATGLPTGLTLNATTGQITGTVTAKTGTYTITYWAQYGTLKSIVQTMQVAVTTFPSGMIGSFEGLLEDGDGLPAGKVSLVVTTTGAFTGKLTAADTKTYSLKGTLALNGDYTTGSATVSVSRGTGITPYSLTVSVSSDSVLGASLSGVGDTDSGVKLKTYASGQTSVWAGAYTMTLGDPVNLGVTAAPEGYGYATVKIGTTGALVAKGKLADGTTLTGTFAVAADGSYRWYVKPYKRTDDYLGGWLTLTERSGEAGRYEASSTDFYWKKPAAATDKLYPAGFGPVSLTVELQKWVAPVAPVSLASLLGLNASGGSLALTMDGGGLTNDDPNTYTLPVTLTLGATGLVTVADATNPTLWNLKVKTTDGSFSGGFTLKDGALSRKVTLQGVFLQQPSPVTDTVIARGYYLVPPVVSTNPTLSGALEISLP